jgi:predicted aldo/keto reductase-like oxidoreductase
MQSNEKSKGVETLHLKSEVIPIEEDEIQPIKNVHEEHHENLNGGITEFYYFEPQQQNVKVEDKSKLKYLSNRFVLTIFSF